MHCSSIMNLDKKEQEFIKIENIIIVKKAAGYGSARVCSWNQRTPSSDQLETHCQDLELNENVSFEINCDQDAAKCPNAYFQIFNVTSSKKCTGNFSIS